eukprot:6179319-Pleurochrysis_carterae.AAC.5
MQWKQFGITRSTGHEVGRLHSQKGRTNRNFLSSIVSESLEVKHEVYVDAAKVVECERNWQRAYDESAR